jgi:ketosteroid isomerase-like protein
MRAYWAALVLMVLVAGASGTVVAAQASKGGAQKSAEARLKELEDRQAIHELLMNYGRTIDTRDFAAFARLWTDDAEYGGGKLQFKGPAAIRERLETSLKARPMPGRDWHFLMNETVTLNGDEATAVSLGAFFVRGESNKLESNSIAIYTDHLVRQDGVWKFKRRVLSSVPSEDVLKILTPPR